MSGMRTLEAIAYASVDGHSLLLDLYLPQAGGPWPVILWVHGGAWNHGTRTALSGSELMRFLVGRGFAMASIDYRLSQEAIFPAQIVDCRAAVRWLRANAEACGWDAESIGASGDSAGGHLVALLGTAAGVIDWDRGAHLERSSAVQAVCDWFGSSDLLSLSAHPSDLDHDAPGSSGARFIGGPLQENPDKAARASPLTHVSGDEPPFLIIHGAQDRAVPHQQSEALHGALQRSGVDSTLHIIQGAGHGGEAFHTPEILNMVGDFFTKHLKRKGH